ncbi:hypothetical protein [Vibrio metschnikovii]|uniref:hypothetical protein n=1 Tax=Vibrio metschnikovii TaxID=28172 RepID=UPI002FCC613F
MNTVAIWLLFFGALPLLYWGFRLAFDSVVNRFIPAHKITIEVEQPDGSYKSCLLDVSHDDKFYDFAMAVIRKRKEDNG